MFKNRVRLLFFSLFVPLVSIATLKLTTYLGDREIHRQLHQSIEKSTKIEADSKQSAFEFFDNLKLNELCSKSTEEEIQWVERLSLQSTCDRWEWSRIAIQVAGGYSLALIAYFLFIAALLPAAKKNTAWMAFSYRIGWSGATVVAIFSTIVVACLLSLAFFELTVALTGRYFPKLLGAIGLAAIIATFTTLKILLQRTSFEFAQGDAAEVSEQDAPELWKRVKALAQKIGTEPPTSILVGSELNFFVTEFSVAHLAGKSHGRVLYLSAPLMKTLSESEVEAIIGHELGHFKGEDTALTKFFYPFKQKAFSTYAKLVELPIVTLPAAWALEMFFDAFEPLLATHSRHRELAADQVGVSVSSPQSMGRALVKTQIHSAAFWEAYREAVETKADSVPAERTYFFNYAKKEEAWSEVLASTVTHPIDSHPPTLERIEALGCDIGTLKQEILSGADSDSAHAVWLSRNSASLKLVEQKQEEALKSLVDQTQRPPTGAERSTPEGRAWLDRNFKALSWEPVSRKVFLGHAFVYVLISVLFTPLAWLGIAHGLGLRAISPLALAVPVALFFLVRHSYRSAIAASIRINADGIQLGTWAKAMAWDEFKNISATVNNGSCTMVLHLNQSSAHPSRFFLFGYKVRTLPVNLMVYKDQYEVLFTHIYRYWSELRTSEENQARKTS